jgi:predicted TIM-barrel fold metal-dependent hydrolase
VHLAIPIAKREESPVTATAPLAQTHDRPRPIVEGLVDADNHYYEPADAFTRHLPRDLEKRRPFRWVRDERDRPRFVVDGRVFRRIVDPTFDPVARPGLLVEMFKNEGYTDYARTGDGLEPIRPEYRDRRARLEVMDQFGVDKIWLFPTLAVNIEQMIKNDAALTVGALRAFNRWLDEDWGFSHHERLYAVPLLSLIDVDAAIDELEWVLDRGARLIHLRACPIPGGNRGRSFCDPAFDRFWARVNEAGVTIAIHSADTGVMERCADWGDMADPPTHLTSRFQLVVRDGREIYEAVADMILHGLFERFPRLRVVSVEMGSHWCGYLLHNLEKVRRRGEAGRTCDDPVELFRHHVFVEPYPEENLAELLGVMTADRVVFGSDWPHPEGTETPAAYFDEVTGISDGDLALIMRENALSLLHPPTD